MRIWLACFGVLFAIAELYQWAKHLTLPFPVYILGGAFLAVASNYNKLAGFFLQDSSAEPPSVNSSGYMGSWDTLEQSPSNQLPQPPQSISFFIKRSGEQNILEQPTSFIIKRSGEQRRSDETK